ncbi:MAG TPA: autotransporter outer membrane beta-barrel domain-containing protein [Crenotrichaceae bacterium]|nr:autotransporter outer membrane beta-barrel domain-containing protein [Crenotrichaceae bacterium]
MEISEKNIESTITKLGIALLVSGTIPNAVAETPINQTKINMTAVIASVCPQGGNSEAFQTRCNAVVRAAGSPQALVSTVNSNAVVDTDGDGGITPLINSINKVAPEQLIVPGVQATRTMTSVASVANAAITSRLDSLRAAMHSPSTTRLANTIQSQPNRLVFAFNPALSGGAAGIADSSRLGIWGNGTYNTGDVNSSINQLGFDFDNWGGTLGVDYRVTDDLVAGAAFTYLNTDADLDSSAGNVESDSYTGTIYATYSHASGFYIDGAASYGAIDFDISRRIQYTLPTDVVNTTAKGDPDGSQYSFGMGIGYQFSVASATIEPFARADYQEYEIDSYRETGGQGWGERFSKQRVRSLPTSVGLRLSNAFSTSWGILQPQVHGAWHHQFKDDSRTITTSFLGDGATSNRTATQFSIVTEGPDRDYYTVGASVNATFANGISAFVAYNTLLGYRDVDSHRVTFGGRLEF